jgi:Domain of unknown function (DUF4440)
MATDSSALPQLPSPIAIRKECPLFQLCRLARIAPLTVILGVGTFTFGAFAASDAATCAGTPADQTQVVETMRTMYAAATRDDLAKFHTVAAPDFYAFDGGQRYDGDALMNTLKSLHASGKVYVWTVTEPHVESDCHLAWITYINRGSIKDASGTKELSWLESAVLEKQAGAWRIHFFHSTRVP